MINNSFWVMMTSIVDHACQWRFVDPRSFLASAVKLGKLLTLVMKYAIILAFSSLRFLWFLSSKFGFTFVYQNNDVKLLYRNHSNEKFNRFALYTYLGNIPPCGKQTQYNMTTRVYSLQCNCAGSEGDNIGPLAHLLPHTQTARQTYPRHGICVCVI